MRLHRPAGTVARDGDPVALMPEDAEWDYCGLRVIALKPGETRKVILRDSEAVVVPLTGSCTVGTDDSTVELKGRSGVFGALTDVCLVGADCSIGSESGGEFAVATSRVKGRTITRYYPAEKVVVEVRGAGAATRQINQLLGADVDGPERLIVVEVITPEGNWSSYPPHKHDEETADELPLEEIYYFRIAGRGGFGLHRTYTDDGSIDETVTVRDGDVFLIPRGYHGPCVAAPGYDMYYLNVMAGPDPERAWRVSTDPVYEWIWEAWRGERTDPRIPVY